MILEKTQGKVLLNKTFVIGCGKLGAEIALDRSKDHKNITVVDKNSSAKSLLHDNFLGEFISFNAMDIMKLKDLGIESASEIVITTGDDNVNIFLCYALRKMCSSKTNIVVRIDDVARGVLLEGLKVSVIYPLQLSFDKYSKFQVKENK